jgi:hypothetical protein
MGSASWDPSWRASRSTVAHEPLTSTSQLITSDKSLWRTLRSTDGKVRYVPLCRPFAASATSAHVFTGAGGDHGIAKM